MAPASSSIAEDARELQRLALRGYQEATSSLTPAFKERRRAWLLNELEGGSR